MMSATTDVLLAAIAELDYVPPALEQQESYLAEHEALRDSTTRRFAAKITGKKEKFEAKASKEEKEYIEALEKEMQYKRQQETLETLITEAKALRLDLQHLAALYSKDDQLEYKLQQAQNRYNEIQGSLNRESQALHLLDSADSALEMCCSSCRRRLAYFDADMYGGGQVTDMMERNALTSAEGHASQAKMFVQQAMMTSPQVQPMGQITIAMGVSFIGDVIFDNIFTDMAFHEKIKASVSNVEDVKSNASVIAQYNLTKLRARGIGAELKVAADALTHARSELNAFRRSVFDSLSGNGNYHEETSYALGPPPPGPRAASPSAWSNRMFFP
ncbi:hypothetical protein B0H14DRAFT_2981176 [Mycena olivaceomarginata]|nr:hypothetical protein B0H14DRAFT_2981176 [Mycena olivaceomarginata]